MRLEISKPGTLPPPSCEKAPSEARRKGDRAERDGSVEFRSVDVESPFRNGKEHVLEIAI